MIPRRGNDGRQAGFALLAAIWFVVVLAFVAVVVAGWMHRSLGLAQRLQDRLIARTATIDAENRVAFRWLSGFFSSRGLELPQGGDRDRAMTEHAVLSTSFAPETPYIALDNRPYKLGTVVVRLQDESGLYSLNHPNRILLGNLLRSYGINYEDRDVLFDRLGDYIDKSDLSRLNGATAADYLQAGRPAPRSAPLLTPWEAARVLSWDDYRALWREPDALADLTAIGDMVMLNPNTAPERILRTLPGMDEASAARVIKYRARYLIQSEADFTRAAGVNIGIDPLTVMGFPSGGLRVTIVSANDPLVRRLAMQLTPTERAPYRVDYAVGLPADDNAKHLAQAADLPALPGTGAGDSSAAADKPPR
jgi:general secretion pathway protein K